MGGRLLAVAAGAAAVVMILLALGRGGDDARPAAGAAVETEGAAPAAAALPEPSGELLSPARPSAERAAEAATEASGVPLERLLAVPDVAGDDDPLRARNPHLRVGDAILPGESGAGKLARRLRLEQRSEDVGSAGRKGAVGETDASVGVPVRGSDAVELRGGVRVQERNGTGEESAETESTPSVGVDVRF